MNILCPLKNRHENELQAYTSGRDIHTNKYTHKLLQEKGMAKKKRRKW